ncbi:hypothetical protein [Pasteuria penetrans]|uniref:hypothetical protein n=1 Tax=Pasteuria penetrans TaxID=86005 RepID=UPI000FA34DB3|nr:hypothetical protein [Pasteuria penetrans]
MSQASIPNITPVISITPGQSISLMLSSVAMEELALAHVINAEAEKIQFVVGTLPGVSSPPVTVSGLIKINDIVNRTLQDVIKTEMLLQFKLENIIGILGSGRI